MGSLLSSLGQGLLLTLALLIAYSYIQDWRRNPARLPYPPGPKGYPIIGNLFDIPNAFIYKRFGEMSREIGQSIFSCLPPPLLGTLTGQWGRRLRPHPFAGLWFPSHRVQQQRRCRRSS